MVVFSNVAWSNLGRCLRPGLLFLFTLAWSSRKRLPLILTVGFLVMDVRMRLEINVVGADDDDNDNDNDNDDDDNDDDEGSDYYDDYAYDDE